MDVSGSTTVYVPENAARAREWQAALDREIEARFEEMVLIRRHLHMYPEVSGNEQESTEFLRRRLVEAGFRLRTGPRNRGLIADPPQPVQAPRVALRGDMDALLIQDAKSTEYRSQSPGVMHACGHDAHTAVTAGALLALQGAAAELPWPVNCRGILQPSEETGTGAREMTAAGAIEGVGAIFALHVDPSRRVGRIGVREGAFTAACDWFELNVRGRGGHAARPHESRDPLAAAAWLASSLYQFIPRATDSHEPVVVTIGQLLAGNNPNVIPEQALLRGTVRTLGAAVRARTLDHIAQLARGVAEASGVQIDLRVEPGMSSVINNPDLTQLVREAGRAVVGGDGVEEIARPSMGGEDFAAYLEKVPGCMFRLGVQSEGTGGAPLHSPEFDIDEKALLIGARILARAAVLWSDPRRHAPEKPSPERTS